MMVLISYDVSTTSEGGKTRLRKIAKCCLDYGQRVQNSVFECSVDQTQWTKLREKLVNLMDEEEDSLRFYFLGKNWEKRIEHIGAKPTLNIEKDTLIC